MKISDMNSLYGANIRPKKTETTTPKPPVTSVPDKPAKSDSSGSSSGGGGKSYYDPNAGSSGSSSGTRVTVSSGGRASSAPVYTPSESGTQAPAADAKAKRTLEDLKNQYNEVLRRNYDYSAGKLKGETDDALRENYIRMRQERAQLPERLAKQGVTGGASETTLANLIANYEGQRNDIRENQQNNLSDLGMNYMNSTAQNEQSYGQQWLQHLLSLAEDEENFKRQVLLKQMGD